MNPLNNLPSKINHRLHAIVTNQSIQSVNIIFLLVSQNIPGFFIPRLIFRGTGGRQDGDLSQESWLHPQGLETKTTCLSDQSPFHSGQPSLVLI